MSQNGSKVTGMKNPGEGSRDFRELVTWTFSNSAFSGRRRLCRGFAVAVPAISQDRQADAGEGDGRRFGDRIQEGPNLAAGETGGVDVQVASASVGSTVENSERGERRAAVIGDECRVIAGRQRHVEQLVVTAGRDAQGKARERRNAGRDAGGPGERIGSRRVNVGCRGVAR